MVMGISFTTIYDTRMFLKQCIDNIAQYGWQDEVFITIVGDKKTPEQDVSYAENSGIRCEYFDIKKQEEWLKDYPKLDIPYNSDNRRNLGYLKSLEQGADVVVSMDDDNFLRADIDFIRHHSIVNEYRNRYEISSNNGWINPCDLLLMEPEIQVFMRGFPFSKRVDIKYKKKMGSGKIVTNVGLWTGVPDVNSMTLLEIQGIRSVGSSGLWDIWLNKEDNVFIAKDAMNIINSQNTALAKEVVSCYYYPKVPEVLFRFPDIWQGFFLKKCINTVGDYVSIGMPLVEHERNVHNLLSDFYKEAVAIQINERLVDLLESIELTKTKSYSTAYLELLDMLEKSVHRLGGTKVQGWFKDIFNIGRVWVDVCEGLM